MRKYRKEQIKPVYKKKILKNDINMQENKDYDILKNNQKMIEEKLQNTKDLSTIQCYSLTEEIFILLSDKRLNKNIRINIIEDIVLEKKCWNKCKWLYRHWTQLLLFVEELNEPIQSLNILKVLQNINIYIEKTALCAIIRTTEISCMWKTCILLLKYYKYLYPKTYLSNTGDIIKENLPESYNLLSIDEYINLKLSDHTMNDLEEYIILCNKYKYKIQLNTRKQYIENLLHKKCYKDVVQELFILLYHLKIGDGKVPDTTVIPYPILFDTKCNIPSRYPISTYTYIQCIYAAYNIKKYSAALILCQYLRALEPASDIYAIRHKTIDGNIRDFIDISTININSSVYAIYIYFLELYIRYKINKVCQDDTTIVTYNQYINNKSSTISSDIVDFVILTDRSLNGKTLKLHSSRANVIQKKLISFVSSLSIPCGSIYIPNDRNNCLDISIRFTKDELVNWCNQ